MYIFTKWNMILISMYLDQADKEAGNTMIINTVP